MLPPPTCSAAVGTRRRSRPPAPCITSFPRPNRTPRRATALQSVRTISHHRHVRVDVRAEELDDHEVVAAGVLGQNACGGSLMRDEELVQPWPPASHRRARVHALPLPHEDAVDALVDRSVRAAWPDDQLLPAELGRTLEDPVLLAPRLAAGVDGPRREVMVLVEVRIPVRFPVDELEGEPLAVAFTVLGADVLPQELLGDDLSV